MRRYFLQHDKQTIKEAIRLYLGGLSIWEVGRQIGYSGQSVNRALRIAGIPRRHGIQPIGSINLDKGKNRVRVKTTHGWKSRYRVMLAKKLGHQAIEGKHVHHKDEDSSNDQLTNLKIVTPSEHRGITNRGSKMRKAAATSWSKRKRGHE